MVNIWMNEKINKNERKKINEEATIKKKNV